MAFPVPHPQSMVALPRKRMSAKKKVAITGGAGYVGSALVPFLAGHGYDVKVVDLFLYGEQVLDGVRCTRVKGDIRDEALLAREFKGMDAVIHLACVSNDPSFELDPTLGKSINFDAFPGILRACRDNGVPRFIYASSSSVYGVKTDPQVREDAVCEPLTDYSKFKLLCEDLLKESDYKGDWVIARPSTVCGYAPRMRFDLVVNILTINALVRQAITVFGGSQLRPNINIQDMIEAYLLLLEAPKEKIHRQTFNIGYENYSVSKLAEIIKAAVGDPRVTITASPSNDLRSYHVNSDKILKALGYAPKHTIEEAVQSIVQAWRDGKVQDPLTNPLYHNIKRMQQVKLSEGTVAI
jgi:nucleoside-diphosphate-sugar epimerase